METTAKKYTSYSNRLAFLQSKWNEIIEAQDSMSHEEIISDAFQTKKKRIGNLYQRANIASMKPRTDAVRRALESVSPNRTNRMANLPTGMIGYNFK